MEARTIVKPKFLFLRLENAIIIKRDNIVLKIDSKTFSSTVEKESLETQQLEAKAKIKKDLFGIFGYIELASMHYLILIEECTIIGQLLKANVFRIEKLLFVPISAKFTMTIAKEDEQFINMIKKLAHDKAFYFSYNIDLTKSIQTNIQETMQNNLSGQSQGNKSAIDFQNTYPNSVDYLPSFAFNNHLLKQFSQQQYSAFRVPVIYGYVFIRTLQSEQNKYDFALISKKDCRRPGRRFIVRGLDREGNAANFVTTEHVITLYDAGTMKVASYLQTRGSIPLIWSQKPTMKWSPAVKINPNFDESIISAQKHINEQKEQYGSQSFINLIDKKGSQLRVGTQFTQLVNQLKDDKIFYVWYDFHHECRKMKWENLSKLIDQVKSKLNEYDYFYAKLDFGMDQRDKISKLSCTIMNNQSGTVRTNCMDCLDRTNVVQSVISRQIAHRQLHKMGIQSQPRGDPFEKFQGLLEDSFRECWTHNANVISILYTGTPALKTDFTRTGKRTMKGALDDGVNSITRYYINNYCDGYNHDCLDVALGKLVPSSKLTQRGFFTPLKLTFIIFGLGCYFLKAFMDAYLPVHETKTQVLHILVYLATFLAGLSQIFSNLKYISNLILIGNGRKFIDDASRFV